MQLSLFESQTTQVQEYPWSGIFEWHPKVGDKCQIGSVIIEGYGYTYGLKCVIKSLNPVKVSTINDKWQQSEHEEILCNINDLWPKIYE